MSDSSLALLILSLICAAVLSNAWTSPPASIVSSHSTAGGCPEDVAEPKFVRGSVCYQFVATELTWVNARRHCQQQSRFSPGRLVSVPDAATQSWLEVQMINIGWSSQPGVWLGLNDQANDNHYVWDNYDGHGIPASYTNWAPNEPYNMLNQHCVQTRAEFGWKWTVAQCNLWHFGDYYFICEFSVESQALMSTEDHWVTVHSDLSTQKRCPAGVLPPTAIYGNACNHFVSTRKTWLKAQEHCRQQSNMTSGRLMNVPDPETQTWLAEQMTSLGWTNSYGVWIGLNDRANEGHFVWDQYEGPGVPAVYTNWVPGEPDNIFKQDCVFMKSENGWKWLDAECNLSLLRRYSFVCQYPLVGDMLNITITAATTAFDSTSESRSALPSWPTQTELAKLNYTFEQQMLWTSSTSDA